MKRFVKELYIFAFGGGAYYILELLFRGYSHYSMFCVGGLCVLFLYKINGWFADIPLVLRALIGAVTISLTEFISGCILNIWLDMNIWNYSAQPLNIFGQVCLLFTFFWFILSGVTLTAFKAMKI